SAGLAPQQTPAVSGPGTQLPTAVCIFLISLSLSLSLSLSVSLSLSLPPSLPLPLPPFLLPSLPPSLPPPAFGALTATRRLRLLPPLPPRLRPGPAMRRSGRSP